MDFPEIQMAEDKKHMQHRTGIYVRAKDTEGKWGSQDIATLEPKSVFKWLRFKKQGP